MVDSRDKRAPERLIGRQDIGEVIRYAAEDLFPKERFAKNEQLLDKRLRALAEQEIPITSRRRFMRVALVTGMMVGLFSVGASALLIYDRYFGEEDGQEESGETIAKQELSNPANKSNMRKELMPEAEAFDTQIPVLPLTAQSNLEGASSQPHRTRGQKKSVLDKQLNLFKTAKKLANKGACRQSISKLDVLDKKYPNGPLGFESNELRAKCLFRMGSFAPAEKLVGTLISNSRSNRKKAELMRFRGDIQVRRGQCDKAIKTYRRALGLGLRAVDSKAAKNGIEKCTR